jgi:sporulation protein YlmC with PRC-barrel domain
VNTFGLNLTINSHQRVFVVAAKGFSLYEDDIIIDWNYIVACHHIIIENDKECGRLIYELLLQSSGSASI